VIHEGLALGVIDPAAREAHIAVIGRLIEAGAEGIVLGCTELGLLGGPRDIPVPSFARTLLHVQAAVTCAPASVPGEVREHRDDEGALGRAHTRAEGGDIVAG
jgi:aspartate racemase